ncbi:hypothetical protein PIB30_056032 [Stylosanthes scabra]|uniref:Uncharacterized protein n=1 Tax=Stylosanthes scabra TaxID=79078 RepID=A0ABU6VIK8_9FABA|nr:hypothetical protein [Stylosanthes scabra]
MGDTLRKELKGSSSAASVDYILEWGHPLGEDEGVVKNRKMKAKKERLQKKNSKKKASSEYEFEEESEESSSEESDLESDLEETRSEELIQKKQKT